MKALTIRQPWASLIALGVKTIETRSWPTKYRGPIAIHAGKHPITLAFAESFNATLIRHDAATAWQIDHDDQGASLAHRDDDVDSGFEQYAWTSGNTVGFDLPLGAIVAAATLADCVPMVDEWPRMGTGNVLFVPTADDLAYPGGSRAHVWLSGDPKGQDVSDQLPYGDFTPGRWAWVLEDVQPTEVRCPVCWGAGERYAANGLRVVCICGDAGHCSPVPAKGRLGLWEWQP